MNDFPKITSKTTELEALLQAIQTQKNELKLFQFLNGLDNVFGPQRSQLLMFPHCQVLKQHVQPSSKRSPKETSCTL